MERKKKSNQQITDIPDGAMSVENMEEMLNERRKYLKKKDCLIIAAVLLIVTGAYLLIHLQTYTSVNVAATYGGKDAGNNSYQEFGKGILKYSRDGISFLNKKGEEVWNQPYQIKTPVICTCGTSAAVADKGGNDIYVFDRKGPKGEIHTTLPIEKTAVSGQGIVSVILKDESSPLIACYDTAGNLLAELKTSFGDSGYPMDISISENGETLMVSFMGMENGRVFSKIHYYNFGDAGKEENNYLTTSDVYEDMLVPSVFFMDKTVSAAVGDHEIILYRGQEKPEAAVNIPLDGEIKSVFHNSRYIGLILKKEGKSENELRLYDRAGKKILSEDFDGDYNHAKISGNQIIMYNGRQCSVYTKNGVHKFTGEFDSAILELIPVFGLNKYIVINADGMQSVQFVK